jgi:hypothetical protein
MGYFDQIINANTAGTDRRQKNRKPIGCDRPFEGDKVSTSPSRERDDPPGKRGEDEALYH